LRKIEPYNPPLSASPFDSFVYGLGYQPWLPEFLILPRFSVLGSEEEIMTVSLWIRETVGGKRRFAKPNKKKIYPEGTIFCLRYTVNGKRRCGNWLSSQAKHPQAAHAVGEYHAHDCADRAPVRPHTEHLATARSGRRCGPNSHNLVPAGSDRR
jgi:hypothetical protein